MCTFFLLFSLSLQHTAPVLFESPCAADLSRLTMTTCETGPWNGVGPSEKDVIFHREEPELIGGPSWSATHLHFHRRGLSSHSRFEVGGWHKNEGFFFWNYFFDRPQYSACQFTNLKKKGKGQKERTKERTKERKDERKKGRKKGRKKEKRERERERNESASKKTKTNKE